MLYRGAASEPGHLLACMVELKGKVASLQCGQFLSQVNQSFFANIFSFYLLLLYQVEKVMFSDWRLISR